MTAATDIARYNGVELAGIFHKLTKKGHLSLRRGKKYAKVLPVNGVNGGFDIKAPGEKVKHVSGITLQGAVRRARQSLN
ncbi:hypothetical protein ACFL14_02835 [Patescibacteria group bacterium]